MRRVTTCPVCDSTLQVTELTCMSCHTRLAGEFPAPPLARIAADHQTFIETFIRCRGVIRDVERALNISYPTVRARLDAAVEALEAMIHTDTEQETRNSERRRTLLEQVEEGILTPEEAAERLRSL